MRSFRGFSRSSGSRGTNNFSDFILGKQTSPRSNRRRSVYLAAGVGLAAVATYEIVKRHKKEQANVKLKSYPEFKRYSRTMKGSFRDSMRGLGVDQRIVNLNFEAIIEGIESDDVEFIHDCLSNISQMGGSIPKNIQRALIAMAANYHNVYILEYFAQEDVFGRDEVLLNDTAKKLLAMPAQLKEKFHYFMQQYYRSPGKITLDGAEAYVKVAQEYALQACLAECEEYPRFSGDIDDDVIQVMHAIERQSLKQAAVKKELAQKFKHTYITDGYNLADDGNSDKYLAEVEIPVILDKVQQDALQTGEKITPIIIIGGAHYTMVAAEVKLNDQRLTDANILFIDSLSCGSDVESSNYYHYRGIPHQVFTGNVVSYLSEDKLQHAPVGCSLVVLSIYEQSLVFDRVFSANTQYSYAGQTSALFKYARDHVTRSGVFGYEMIDDEEYDKFKHLAKFSMFLLPVAMIGLKQSLSSQEQEVVFQTTYSPLPDGQQGMQRDFEGIEIEGVVIEGHTGLNIIRETTSEERQQEFKSPRDLTGQTVDEFIDENTKSSTTNAYKPQNKATENESYRIGYNAGQYFTEHTDSLEELRVYEDKDRTPVSYTHN